MHFKGIFVTLVLCMSENLKSKTFITKPCNDADLVGVPRFFWSSPMIFFLCNLSLFSFCTLRCT